MAINKGFLYGPFFLQLQPTLYRFGKMGAEQSVTADLNLIDTKREVVVIEQQLMQAQANVLPASILVNPPAKSWFLNLFCRKVGQY
jgi:hypothetical protein